MRLGLYDENRGLGVAARVSVTVEPGAFWNAAIDLTPSACDAVRVAYRCARALVDGVPPYLRNHRIHLDVPRGEIDGPSLGLPVALAFIQAWTDNTCPKEIAATGALKPWGAVGAVGAVPEKTRALHAAGVSTVLVPPMQVGDGRLGVGSLSDAVKALGWPEKPVLAHRPKVRVVLRHAEDLIDRVRNQDLGDHQNLGMPAWVALADELLACAEHLERQKPRHPREALSARCHASLAYAHAGHPDAVAVLKRHEVLDGAPAGLKLLHAMATLATALDGGRVDPALIQTLAQQFEATPVGERHGLSGLALGTWGRAHMHARQLDRALPLLEHAAAVHLQEAPNEHGRSLIYLAMAQRMDGRPEQALETLARARASLVEHTRPYDGSYYRHTLMFWFYEAARSSLDAGDSVKAELLAGMGLSSADDCDGHFWPGIGLRRTAAWACRERNLLARAQRHVEALQDAIFDGAPPAIHRIREEAQGAHRTDGEVY